MRSSLILLLAPGAAGFQAPARAPRAAGRSAQCQASAAPLSSARLLAQLADGACLFEQCGAGVVTVTGGDRLRFLHGQTTNEFEAAPVGSTFDTVLTTPTGKIRDLVIAAVLPDEVRLLCAPGRAAEVAATFDKYLFPLDDTAVRDDSAGSTIYSLAGAGVERALASAGLPMPPAGGALELERTVSTTAAPYLAEASVLLLDGAGLDAPGVTLVLDAAAAPQLAARLEGALGVWPCTGDEFALLAALHGRPRAAELTLEFNPLEAGLLKACSFDKGCYVGQETIARLKDGAAVRRRLRGLQLDAPLKEGTTLFAAPAEGAAGAASVPSAAPRAAAVVTRCLPTEEGVVGLAYVRTKLAAVGDRLVTEDGAVRATVVALPLAEFVEPLEFADEPPEEEGETPAEAPGCSLADRGACSERELAFLDKWDGKPAPVLAMQVEMLSTMAEGNLKPDVKAWVATRLGLLAQMQERDAAA